MLFFFFAKPFTDVAFTSITKSKTTDISSFHSRDVVISGDRNRMRCVLNYWCLRIELLMTERNLLFKLIAQIRSACRRKIEKRVLRSTETLVSSKWSFSQKNVNVIISRYFQRYILCDWAFFKAFSSISKVTAVFSTISQDVSRDTSCEMSPQSYENFRETPFPPRENCLKFQRDFEDRREFREYLEHLESLLENLECLQFGRGTRIWSRGSINFQNLRVLTEKFRKKIWTYKFYKMICLWIREKESERKRETVNSWR